MFGLGWQELLIVLVIIMIIFGAGKLPSLFKDLGSGVKEFKAAATDEALPGSGATTTTTTTTASGSVVTGDGVATGTTGTASDPSRV